MTNQIDMKTIEAIIERAKDGTFSVYCTDEMFSGMGDTPEAAIQNMKDSMQFFLEGAKSDGYQYPRWLDGEYKIECKYDVQSLLTYYTGIITPAALGRLTGINPKQIWSYAHGKSKPRPAQIDKIQAGLRKLGSELSSISLL